MLTSVLILDECIYPNHLHISGCICHIFSCQVGATIISGTGAVQRRADAPLRLLLLPLAILFAACLVRFSPSCRVVYQLVGLQPLCPFLLSLSEGLRSQTPSCSLTGLRFLIDYLCNRFILWILSFYSCYTMQFCWTSNWRFHNILFPWDVCVVVFIFYQ